MTSGCAWRGHNLDPTLCLQVPRLPVVPGTPGLRRAGRERPSLQQDPQRVRPGVPDHSRTGPPAEAEEGQPPREEQDQGEDDH